MSWEDASLSSAGLELLFFLSLFGRREIGQRYYITRGSAINDE